ncbi:hypothetical protein SISNIDRAFT_546128 [Sistotremastrum niveocremeum HHB9708]|uniref:Protein PBN1 n=2 Tax=Sistotremastraceae TaxID=3402574 RepID=A0A165ANB9_9AGAM|nr:hypothetical protein SISNIDRAFT_546128 [Sistotremastrum niveocremeum HHB9708]KZT37003.1 hypothetical protein SISSUDRAFT_1129986 [Sistotremastrum suecicum HHB10207 ss-3]
MTASNVHWQLTAIDCSFTLQPAHGFHRQATFAYQLDVDASNCSVVLDFALAPLAFIDSFELDDLTVFHSITPESDTEAPLMHVEHNGDSNVLVVTDKPSVLNIPLHLRYGRPGASRYDARPIEHLSCSVLCHDKDLTWIASSSSRHFQHNRSKATSDASQRHYVQVPIGHLPDLSFIESLTSFILCLAATALLFVFISHNPIRTLS